MGARARQSVAVAAALALAASGSAQTAQFQWLISTDEGASWQGGTVQVPQAQSSVLVRSLCSWTPAGPPTAFQVARFDAVVLNAGQGDVVHDAVVRQLPSMGSVPATRFGSTIKIDHPLDDDLPGLGTRWLQPQNGNPLVFATTENPFFMVGYTLALDGTPGTRVASQVFQELESIPTRRYVRLYSNVDTSQSDFVPVVAFDVAITVLPTPGAIALLALGGVVAARRRR